MQKIMHFIGLLANVDSSILKVNLARALIKICYGRRSSVWYLQEDDF
jgi:hypothetical protein